MSCSEMLNLTMCFIYTHMFLNFCASRPSLMFSYHTLLHVQKNVTVSCRAVGKIHEQCFIMH